MERILVTGATNIGKAGVATIVYKWGQQFDENNLVLGWTPTEGEAALRKSQGKSEVELRAEAAKVLPIVLMCERKV